MRFSCFYIYIISMNAEQLILTFYMNYVWCSRSRECLKFLIKAEESKMKWVEVITKLRYYDTWHQTTLVTKDTHVCVHTYRDACRVGDGVLFYDWLMIPTKLCSVSILPKCGNWHQGYEHGGCSEFVTFLFLQVFQHFPTAASYTFVPKVSVICSAIGCWN